ncbi:hypothetical protein HPB49_003142 [Dermacentor silvarum]|uniref:Uncharacterized protein n=1 Tax=Dermacentor silvarum TaxID=543639 RepID=A0ACB8DT54_DERSI|nr:hypothetical protein HPB49_003142 [Dermacentor silvarum]
MDSSYPGPILGRPRGRSRGRLLDNTPQSPALSRMVAMSEISSLTASVGGMAISEEGTLVTAKLFYISKDRNMVDAMSVVCDVPRKMVAFPPSRVKGKMAVTGPASLPSRVKMAGNAASFPDRNGVKMAGGESEENLMGIVCPGPQALATTSEAGRGAWRGQSDELALLATRPKIVSDKCGKTGNPVELLANYFRLVSLPQWCVHQYHVDFLPLVESSRIRRALIGDHCEQFGRCFVFDGMSDLKTPTRLKPDLLELHSQRPSDGTPIVIRIKWVQQLAPIHPEVLRLLNIQMRHNLEHPGFMQISRHFFDKYTASTIPQHGLEFWQGLVTTIGQHETGIMMVTHPVHKLGCQQL